MYERPGDYLSTVGTNAEILLNSLLMPLSMR